jgi:GAF domain-containing protein
MELVMHYDRFDPQVYNTTVGQRMQRVRELGIGTAPDPEFDKIATELAERAGTQFAMVNFLNDREQYFAGLHTPDTSLRNAVLEVAQPSGNDAVDRTMPLDHGWCPIVVNRNLALPIGDVRGVPRWIGNPVIDKLGLNTYLGTPLVERIETPDGIVQTNIGTICAVDTEVHKWTRDDVAMINTMAAELVELIHQRARRSR